MIMCRCARMFAIMLLIAAGWAAGWVGAAPLHAADPDREAFEAVRDRAWKELFSDDGAGDWRQQWFLDGVHAKVRNDHEKMTIDTAGGYAVLWTKQSFSGDLRIEYDFLRADNYNKGVNIIYIQATGDGEKGHDEDITKWSDRRSKAAMSDYYQNMHTYHVSYAAFPKDYIRARRYRPLKNKGLSGTQLSGETPGDSGLFSDKQWVHVTIVKHADQFWMEFKHPDKTRLCHFDNTKGKPVTHGRIGLRLMPKRQSHFKNFKIMSPEAGQQ